MINKSRNYRFLAFVLATSGLLAAQESNPTATQGQQNGDRSSEVEMRDGIAIYRIQVVGRQLSAINYFHRNGSTKIGFRGTDLLPQAKSNAKVEARGGRTSIEAGFEGLSPANGFGTEYLTYVLWGNHAGRTTDQSG